MCDRGREARAAIKHYKVRSSGGWDVVRCRANTSTKEGCAFAQEGRHVARGSSRAPRGEGHETCAKTNESGIRGLWRTCCRASRGLRGSDVCGKVTMTRWVGGSACTDSVGERRNAGAAAGGAHLGGGPGAERDEFVGTLGNISDIRGKEAWRISGDGSDGERLGKRCHGTLEMWEMVLGARSRPLGKCNIEAVVVCRRRDIEMED
ncbi:hypothetical protein H4582DRAFT_2131658 [Lactarius indigo]|nr:hypothetical protein H4582DRAFT_2131658 [Lactarius indigo]